MKSQQQAKDWIYKHEGVGVDFDGAYGFQCMDLAVAYIYYITDGKVRMWGNAKDAINNDFKGLATVYENTPSFKPQLGDVAVYINSQYGHIQCVTSGNLDYYTCLEQNWLGGGFDGWEKATIRTHYYDGVTHFIRPKFSASNSNVLETSKVNTFGNWKQNQYGTYYRNENATFTCGFLPIFARVGSPKLSEPNGYWFQPNGYTPYDEVCLSDGLVWIGYNWQGTRYYLPVRQWNGKTGNAYSIGVPWGVFS
ncbi:endolysin [Staphylococcus phage JPL-50]|uniref:N-acetylmuramoyl-L-alanine amidase n=1 Tax=Staphylococcus phage JPL-50 TaxID=2851077 RepID=A0A8F3C9N7_9CAUD|nr:endolysin [Staphylococcus phage JPL-50]QWY14498.1 endolysin [Staphylococcus phage JPL-50]